MRNKNNTSGCIWIRNMENESYEWFDARNI